MIVNTGKMLALDELLSNLTGSVVRLVGAPFDDTDPTLTISSLMLIDFGGVSEVALGIMPSATMDGTRAKSTRGSPAIFNNSSGSTVTIYGWAWISGGTLLGCKELAEAATLANGADFNLTPTIYMDNLTV